MLTLVNEMLLFQHAQMQGIELQVKRKLPRQRKGYVEQLRFNQITINRSAFSIQHTIGWQYDGEKIDALEFTVSKQVAIIGMGICVGCGTYTVNVQIIDISSSNIMFDQEFSFSVHSIHQKIYKLLLDTAIQIMPNKRYCIKLLIQGPASCFIEKGQAQVTHNGITISFFKSDMSTNSTDVVFGQMPELMFVPVRSQFHNN